MAAAPIDIAAAAVSASASFIVLPVVHLIDRISTNNKRFCSILIPSRPVCGELRQFCRTHRRYNAISQRRFEAENSSLAIVLGPSAHSNCGRPALNKETAIRAAQTQVAMFIDMLLAIAVRCRTA